MKITFRRWEQTDAESVRVLLRETWLDAYGGFIPREDIFHYLEEHYSIEEVRLLMQDPDVAGFVAEVDGNIRGCEKTFYHREEKRLYVHQLYIHPEFQGLGLGKQLMLFAAERAKTMEQDRVWLGVMTENLPAISWYKKMGYQIVDQMPFTMGRTHVDHYIGYVTVQDIEAANSRSPRRKHK